MRIAINCRSFLLGHYAGIGRYSYNLVKSLAVIDSENDYVLYAPKKLFDFKRRLPRFDVKNFHPALDLFDRGASKILKHVDIYHSPSPDRLPEMNARIIVTVHDLIYKIYPQGHTDDAIQRSEVYFHELAQKADRVICCSQSTLNDLQRFFPSVTSKAIVIYQGVDKKLFRFLGGDERKNAEGMLAQKGVSFAYILFIGTIEPRKNLTNLIKAFSILKKEKIFEGKLVVVGMKGWMQENLAAVIDAEKLRDDVVFLGYLTDSELCALYNSADVFVFPSFYEGFGFPILEAFSCGTPVVTSNTSACAEVAGDAALQSNPADCEEIAKNIKSVLQNKDLARQLREKGFRRAEDFSFTKTAQETWRVYKETYYR